MEAAHIPSVDVLVATYNRRSHIERLLRSLRKQTYGNFRILVRDDGSSDGTVEMVRSQFPEVNLVAGGHLGLIGSKSALLTSAQSKYLIFLDDDGYLLQEDAIEGCVAQMESHPFYGCLSLRLVLPDGTDEYNVNVAPGVCITFFVEGAYIMRKAVVDQLGGYCDLLECAEGNEYTMRMVKHGWPVVFFSRYAFLHMREPVGRDEARISRCRLRSRMLVHVLHSPIAHAFPRTVMLLLYSAWAAVRDGRPSDFAWVLRSSAEVFPKALRRRNPMSLALWAAWRSVFDLSVTPERFVEAYRRTPEAKRFRPDLG